MDATQWNHTLSEIFIKSVSNGDVQLERSCLQNIIAARLNSTEDDHLRTLHEFCLEKLGLAIEETRRAAWDAYAYSDKIETLRPILRAEYNSRVFKYKSGIVTPTFDFDFSSSYHAVAAESLEDQMRYLLIFLDLDEGWNGNAESERVERAEAQCYESGERLFLQQLGLRAGAYLPNADVDTMLRERAASSWSRQEVLYLQDALQDRLSAAEEVVEEDEVMKVCLPIGKHQAARLLMAIADAEYFEQLTGHELFWRVTASVRIPHLRTDLEYGQLIQDAARLCKKGEFRVSQHISCDLSFVREDGVEFVVELFGFNSRDAYYSEVSEDLEDSD